AGKRVPMASTTKIMTARLALQSLDPRQDVVVPPLDMRWDEMDVNLSPGQVLPVEKLMEALLVASGGDAARTLAVAVAGSEKAFVEQMNREAQELGLDDTHYANSHGLDTGGHYTSARDLSLLARLEMEDPEFAGYVAMPSTTIPQQDDPKPLKVESSNTLMLRNEWVDGVKTGYTDKAGSCLVASGDYEQHDMIVTVLGAPDPETRNQDVVKLFKYGASLYVTWRSPEAGQVMASASVSYSRLPLQIVLADRFSVSIPPGAKVTSDVTAPRVAEPPVAGDEELGRVVYKVDGTVRDERALLADRAVPTADWRSRLRFRLARVWQRSSAAVAAAVKRAVDPRAVFTPAF
ncbi:MAG: D-alanyl-D-alanine carboxypeptidase, partial [Actinobacteria bacterium]|nr:D-alanyl-D-alanine carboxypeptidase [Actinomycetota bacterium]